MPGFTSASRTSWTTGPASQTAHGKSSACSRRACARPRRTLATLQPLRAAGAAPARHRPERGDARPAEITRLLEYGQILAQQIVEQRQVIAQRQQEADAQQQRVIALAKDAKALEKLRERQLEEYQQEDARREQAETSEIASIAPPATPGLHSHDDCQAAPSQRQPAAPTHRPAQHGPAAPRRPGTRPRPARRRASRTRFAQALAQAQRPRTCAMRTPERRARRRRAPATAAAGRCARPAGLAGRAFGSGLLAAGRSAAGSRARPAARRRLDVPGGFGPIVRAGREEVRRRPGPDRGRDGDRVEVQPGRRLAGWRARPDAVDAGHRARPRRHRRQRPDARTILGGAKLLGQLLEKYNGNLELALAAYNAGSGAVDKHGGIPPYAETRKYVPLVLRRLRALPGAGRQRRTSRSTAARATGR